MINFDDEVKKFKPSTEIGDVEEALLQEDENDLVDLMMEMMNEYRENR